jgi:tectonic-1/3
VARFVDGLPLPLAAPGGRCSAAARGAVGFGTTASSSCAVPLDRAGLQALCTGGNAAQQVQAVLGGGLYQELAEGRVLVGSWGNANMSVAEEWVQVLVSGLPAAAPSWDPLTSTCSGLVTGFDLQLVTGLAGAAKNPLRKALYASLCFRTGSWRFVDGSAPAAAQRFWLGFGVQHVAKPQAARSAMKPAPPLFRPLPADVLYPFVSGAGAARASAAGVVAAAAAALVVLALF